MIEAAAGTGVDVLSLSEAQVDETGRTRLVIPAGTYPGQERYIVTTSLPVIAYTTTKMDADTAHALTKTYWQQKEALGEAARWWDGVTPALLDNIDGPIHEGALRYYDEAGIEVPGSAR